MSVVKHFQIFFDDYLFWILSNTEQDVWAVVQIYPFSKQKYSFADDLLTLSLMSYSIIGNGHHHDFFYWLFIQQVCSIVGFTGF